jgi:hypothetical protein
MKNYQIKNNNKFLHDAASVRFHVESDDYFGTVATILKLMQYNLRDAIKKTPKEERVLIEQTFKNLGEDLIILQNNYQIKAKTKKNQKELKGRLNSQ